MPIVIPAAAGAVLLFLADLALSILIVGGILMMVGLIYWLLTHIRDQVRGLVIVGGAAARIIDIGLNTTIWVARSYENVIKANLFYLARNVRMTLHYFIAPVVLPIWNLLYVVNDHVAGLERYVGGWVTVTILTINDHVVGLERYVGGFVTNTLLVLNDRVGGLERYVGGFVTQTLLVLNDRVFHAERAIGAHEAQLVQQLGMIAELQAFLPLLRALADFEAKQVHGLEGMGARVGDLERTTDFLTRDLQKVLPLSVVVALGIAAVANLERLARDPCHCLTVGDFNDLPARVSALEEMGP